MARILYQIKLSIPHVQTLKLDSDIEKELTEMQEKGIDINEFLREALKKRKEKLEEEKKKIATEIDLAQRDENFKIISYIPIKIRKIINEEHGTKCSIPGCPRSAKILHHSGRFALMRNHDPRFIAPLCEEHHEIAHKMDVKYVRMGSGG